MRDERAIDFNANFRDDAFISFLTREVDNPLAQRRKGKGKIESPC